MSRKLFPGHPLNEYCIGRLSAAFSRPYHGINGAPKTPWKNRRQKQTMIPGPFPNPSIPKPSNPISGFRFIRRMTPCSPIASTKHSGRPCGRVPKGEITIRQKTTRCRRPTLELPKQPSWTTLRRHKMCEINFGPRLVTLQNHYSRTSLG